MYKSRNYHEFRFLVLCAIFFGIVFWFIPSTDYRLSKVDCAKLLKLGNEKYLKDFKFDLSWNFKNPACNSPETTILNALYFLDTTAMILPDDEPDFNFYAWAKNINPTLRRETILAFSGTANFSENRIDISNLELEKLDPVLISNILVHELRHLDQGSNTHVPCIKHKRSTCDARLEENPFKGGAYNYNVAYLHRLISYGAISRSQKYSASTLLSNVLETRINLISEEMGENY